MRTSQLCPKPHLMHTAWSGLVLAGLLLSGCGSEPPPAVQPPLVEVIQIADAESLSKSIFPGRAKAGQEVNLSFRVNGPLTELPVQVGTEVKQGDVVAQLDDTDFKIALKDARASHKQASADFKRGKELLPKGHISRSDYDKLDARFKTTAANLEQTQQNLNYTTLKAPFSGVVVETYVKNFETIISKQPILRLLDPSSIEFVISVPENLIKYAAYVEDISVTFDAFSDKTIEAKIKEIGKEASRATRTYPVTLVMAQPEDAEILAGMAGSARITAKIPEGSELAGMEIPATAVFSGEDKARSYVWVVDQAAKTLGRREVETGRLTEYGVRIRSGLNPGDTVVIKGVHSIMEGQKVRIMNNKGASL